MGQVLLLDYKGQAAVVPCVELRKRFHSSPSVLLGVLRVVGSAGDQAKGLTRVRQALCPQPSGCTGSSPRDRYLSYFSYCTSPCLKTTELRCRKATRVHKALPPAGREVRRQPLSNLFYRPSQDAILQGPLFCRALGGGVL